jgi:hypothetical protein
MTFSRVVRRIPRPLSKQHGLEEVIPFRSAIAVIGAARDEKVGLAGFRRGGAGEPSWCAVNPADLIGNGKAGESLGKLCSM